MYQEGTALRFPISLDAGPHPLFALFSGFDWIHPLSTVFVIATDRCRPGPCKVSLVASDQCATQRRASYTTTVRCCSTDHTVRLSRQRLTAYGHSASLSRRSSCSGGR